MKSKFRNITSAIAPGDLLLTEQPFAFVLSSKEQGNRCDNCLEKVKLLKCSGCQFVYYCGRTCQKDAWADHKWECANFKRVAPKVLPDGARMLAKIIHRLNRGDGHSYRAFYSANSFRMWKDLMSHYSDLKADKKRMEHFTTLCGVLYEFLSDVSLPNTVELMGMYGRMVINSFMILDMDMNSIGTGVYLASSIVDHSCDPNAVVTFHGKTINIRATKEMPNLDWNQIRISYIDLLQTPFDRQSELLSSYYFLCECVRCMDDIQINYVHAAKCLNTDCDSAVNIPWKENCQLVRKPSKKDNDEKSTKNSSTDDGNDDSKDNNHKELDDVKFQTDESREISLKNDDKTLPNGGIIHKGLKSGEICCKECGTKYTKQHEATFVNVMEFTQVHLQSMVDASIAYVDVCNYCLERQGVLHPLNLLHAQTLDHAFDALIQMQLWDKACIYAEKLIPCFRFYYGHWNPLLGLLHMKYGKILLYKMDLRKAVEQFKYAEKVIKVTHGEFHSLYREHLMPLLQQAILESS